MHETVWGVAGGARLHWREWDGEVVLFHENSANIHQLNAVAVTALQLLIDEPAGNVALAQRTASSLAIDVDGPLQDDIDQLLSQLKRLGIIQAVQP